MLLHGELIFLGEGVPEQQQKFLYAIKITFTVSESCLEKQTINPYLWTPNLILMKVLLLVLNRTLKVILWSADVSVVLQNTGKRDVGCVKKLLMVLAYYITELLNLGFKEQIRNIIYCPSMIVHTVRDRILYSL